MPSTVVAGVSHGQGQCRREPEGARAAARGAGPSPGAAEPFSARSSPSLQGRPCWRGGAPLLPWKASHGLDPILRLILPTWIQFGFYCVVNAESLLKTWVEINLLQNEIRFLRAVVEAWGRSVLQVTGEGARLPETWRNSRWASWLLCPALSPPPCRSLNPSEPQPPSLRLCVRLLLLQMLLDGVGGGRGPCSGSRDDTTRPSALTSGPSEAAPETCRGGDGPARAHASCSRRKALARPEVPLQLL